MELTDPYGKSLYKDVKKQYDSYTWTTDSKGVYKFCFSNEFSTFTHKVVYFDLEVGDEDPLAKKEGGDAHATAMTMVQNFIIFSLLSAPSPILSCLKSYKTALKINSFIPR
jgi:protein ERP2